MATFKVGQRVRLLPTNKHPWTDEGIIVAPYTRGYVEGDWEVRADSHPAPGTGPNRDCWICCNHELAPLTDPGADAFLESIRKLKPYEEPKVPQREETRIPR